MIYRTYYAKLLCIAMVASGAQAISAAGQTINLKGNQTKEELSRLGVVHKWNTQYVTIMIYNKSDKPLYFGIVANTSTIVRPFVTIAPQATFTDPLSFIITERYDERTGQSTVRKDCLMEEPIDVVPVTCFPGLELALEGNPQSGFALTYTNPNTTPQQDFGKNLYPLKITYDLAADYYAARNTGYNYLIVTSNAEGKPVVSKPIYAATPDEALRKAQEEGVRQTIKNVFK